MTELQLTELKAKEVSKTLKSVYGVIASPEDVKDFNLGLGIRGEWVNSKKELIRKYLEEVHGEISSPQKNLYELYMSRQQKRKKSELPNFMRI